VRSRTISNNAARRHMTHNSRHNEPTTTGTTMATMVAVSLDEDAVKRREREKERERERERDLIISCKAIKKGIIIGLVIWGGGYLLALGYWPKYCIWKPWKAMEMSVVNTTRMTGPNEV